MSNLCKKFPFGKGSSRLFSVDLILFFVIMFCLSGCATDTITQAPVDFTFEGTYVLIEIQITGADGQVDVVGAENTFGFLEIRQADFTHFLEFYQSSGRVSGPVEVTDDQISLKFSVEDSQTGELISITYTGVYDFANDLLKVSYTVGNQFFVEVWRRVVPV